MIGNEGEKDGMTGKRNKNFLKLLGSKGTADILLYLEEHGATQHKEFDLPISRFTLDERLRQLLKFGLITHRLTRENVKKEWYEITDAGRKTVKHLKRLIEISAPTKAGREDE
ncbi:MAG: winged helix-turn-helix transcriptional regulator [Theionarchaea archaeon]|nr:MAG: hypothetical protein AYK18_11755 [Theionarchaea archaeon DG-70]MBU7011603.1 winged helix-turn-helix transcriptional regulator [Theionarchaea archaeon]